LIELFGQVSPHDAHESLTAFATHGPKCFVGNGGDPFSQVIRHTVPAFYSAGIGPDAVGLGRIPSRHVHAVGDVANRNFAGGPAWEERLKDASAEFSMQPADAM